MLISIIPEDKAIVVGGVALTGVADFAKLGINPLVHAVQYDTETERGEIEFKQLPGLPQIPNQVINMDQFKGAFGAAQELHAEVRRRAAEQDEIERHARESAAAMEEAERENAEREAAAKAAEAAAAEAAAVAMTPNEKLEAIRRQVEETKALADALLAQAEAAHKEQIEKDAAELQATLDAQMNNRTEGQ